jgi:DNA polymerase-3 subunit beta
MTAVATQVEDAGGVAEVKPARFEVDEREFAATLRLVGKAMPGKRERALRDWLGAVVVKAQGDRVVVRGGFDPVSVAVPVRARVRQEGEFAVSQEALLSAVGKPRRGKVVVVEECAGGGLEEAMVALHREGATYRVKGLSVADIPPERPVEGAVRFWVGGEALCRVGAVAPFVAPQKGLRPGLEGVLMEVRPDRLRFVGTDGHRLAMLTLPVGAEVKMRSLGAAEVVSAVLPAKAANLVSMLFEGDAGVDVVVSDDGKAVSVEGGGKRLVALTVDAVYPQYTAVVPSGDPKMVLVLRRGEAVAALQRCLEVLPQEPYKVVLTCPRSGDSAQQAARVVTLVAKVDGQVAVREVLYDVEWVGPEFRVALNAEYFAELLKAMPKETVAVGIWAADRALRLWPVGGGVDYMQLLMPVRLDEDDEGDTRLADELRHIAELERSARGRGRGW